MAQFMLSVWHDDDYDLDFSGPDAQRRVAQVEQYNADLIGAGALVFAAGLHPRSAAEVMRPEGSNVVATPGPFSPSREHIGGFWIIEAAGIDDAREWARRGAAACEGPVELRPLQSE